MPDKKGRFTRQEAVFVERYAATGDRKYAAKEAGYRNPAVAACEALQRPAVQAEILKKQRERLTTEIVPLAIERHLQLLRDKSVGGQTLNRAIELAYKYGFAAQEGLAAKEPHEMTPEELSAAIAALERAAGDKARPVEAVDVSHDPAVGGLFD